MWELGAELLERATEAALFALRYSILCTTDEQLMSDLWRLKDYVLDLGVQPFFAGRKHFVGMRQLAFNRQTDRETETAEAEPAHHAGAEPAHHAEAEQRVRRESAHRVEAEKAQRVGGGRPQVERATLPRGGSRLSPPSFQLASFPPSYTFGTTGAALSFTTAAAASPSPRFRDPDAATNSPRTRTATPEPPRFREDDD